MLAPDASVGRFGKRNILIFEKSLSLLSAVKILNSVTA